METYKGSWSLIGAQVVSMAIRHGQLIKPEICSKCGAKKGDYIGEYRARIRIEAHHHNHNFPLRVTWLCQPCHTKLHKKFKPVKFRLKTIQ